jgi:hypothetical protein
MVPPMGGALRSKGGLNLNRGQSKKLFRKESKTNLGKLL